MVMRHRQNLTRRQIPKAHAAHLDSYPLAFVLAEAVWEKREKLLVVGGLRGIVVGAIRQLCHEFVEPLICVRRIARLTS